MQFSSVMRNASKLAALAAAVVVSSLASTAGATTYNTLYIHGRTSSPATPTGNSYWVASGSSIAAGTNIQYVNWNGNNTIPSTNSAVVTALNTYCTGSTACVIACHSAGCAQIGYAIAYKSGTPYNIYSIVTAGSASAGSEIAGSTSGWLTGEAIDSELGVTTMRALYNHDLTGDNITNYVYNELGSDYEYLTTCLFEGGCVGGGGQNDSAVSFQSSGEFRASGTEGSDGANGAKGGNWWDYRIAWRVNTSETWGHCVTSSFATCESGGPSWASHGIASAMAYDISGNSW